MIRIETPRVRATLYTLCRKMLAGIKRFSTGAAPAIPLKGTSQETFTADFRAATQAEDEFQACRALKSDSIGARERIETQITTWIGDAKTLVFRKLWGAKWVVAYAQIGFRRNASIETPTDRNEKLEILRSIGTWLRRNPAMEVVTKDVVTGQEIQITAARAVQLEEALDAAINKIASCESDIDAKALAREQAEDHLRGRIRLVAGELDLELDAMDARWLAYGLDKPGETERPGQVTNVQVSQPSANHIRVVWDPAERAVRYKLRAQVEGKDAELRVVAEVYEEQADLYDFAPGDVVKLDLVAINIAGESNPSEPVRVRIPVAVAA